MAYEFDAGADRRGTGAIKLGESPERADKQGLIPLWVADMDFRAPEELLDVLRARVDHGVFGYTEATASYYEAVREWFAAHYGWKPEREWIVLSPGVVFAIATAVRAFTDPGDAVLIQRPVYYPFTHDIERNGRVVANAPLVLDEASGRYVMDFDAMERVLDETGAKLMILSNPHNPVGRAWTAAELERLGRICLEHGTIVVSDEIHADFIRPGHTHTAFASISEEFAQMSVTCTAASKTFNLAGLQTSNIVIPNEELRARYQEASDATGWFSPNIFGLCATETVYRQGGEWLTELQDYLEGNFELLGRGIEKIDGLSLIEAEATYLAWIDCRPFFEEQGFDDAAFERFIEDEAGLWLDMGDIFGPEGSGFIRVNIACPRSTVEAAVEGLAAAVAARRKA